MSPSSRDIQSRHPELQLVNWPLRDDWMVCLLTVGLIVGITGLVYWASLNAIYAILTFIVFVLCSWKLWIPVNFTVGPRGLIIESVLNKSRLTWREVDHYQLHRKGLMVYTTSDDSPLANLRGIYINAGEQLEELQQLIDYYQELRTGGGSSILRYENSGSVSKLKEPTEQSS